MERELLKCGELLEHEAAYLAESLPVSRRRPHHLLDPLDVVVGEAEELEYALDEVVPDPLVLRCPRATPRPSVCGGEWGRWA